MADTTPQGLAKQLLVILYRDLGRLERIDRYLRGHHDDPYMPSNADDEYVLLAKRCVSNWTPLLVSTPAQSLYVDGFRRGSVSASESIASSVSPEWDHWQRSRMDARQLAVHRGALAFGHSFVVTTKVKGQIVSKGLSALRTAAVFEDTANDDTPYAALTVDKWEVGESQRGKARLWDGRNEYVVTFTDFGSDPKVYVQNGRRHGASECPVTRFAAAVDLEGRTTGVIEPVIALQNRINQTVFDLLVAQTYGSFKVRTVTGMAPPIERDALGEPVLDAHGNAKPIPMNHNAKRFLFAEDENVKWGSLDETPLGGFIDSVDMSIRHLSAISQTPPHYLLGQIANLSAEALNAAETSLLRKVEEFRKSFGESWERVFRLAGELAGVANSAQDFHGEVLWRDMESKSLSQTADALGKLKENLEIPAQGLWSRVPGVTQSELGDWKDLAQEADATGQLANAVTRATSTLPRVASDIPAGA